MSSEAGAAFVAVVVTLVVTAIVLICLFRILKHWTIRRAQETAATPVSSGIESRSHTECVPHHPQKISELSVGRRGYKIQHEESHELMGRNRRQELPGHESRRPRSSFRKRQELFGEGSRWELSSSPYRRGFERYEFDEPDFGILNESALSLHEFV